MGVSTRFLECQRDNCSKKCRYSVSTEMRFPKVIEWWWHVYGGGCSWRAVSFISTKWTSSEQFKVLINAADRFSLKLEVERWSSGERLVGGHTDQVWLHATDRGETDPLHVKIFSWSLKYLMYDFKLCLSYTYCNYFIILRKPRQSDSHPAANSVQIITQKIKRISRLLADIFHREVNYFARLG